MLLMLLPEGTSTMRLKGWVRFAIPAPAAKHDRWTDLIAEHFLSVRPVREFTTEDQLVIDAAG